MSMLKCTNPIPSSVVDFQRRVIGKGTTSVMENSRTLNAGDKMAHCIQTNTKHINALTACFVLFFTNHLKVWIETGSDNHLKCTTSSDSFICIEGGADVFAEKPADSLFDSWDSCRSSNYLHSVDVIAAQLCQKKKKKQAKVSFL